MPESVTNELIYETLKKIQNGMADQRSAMADLRADVREVKGSNAMIIGMIGEMVKGAACDDERFARLEARIEDLEHRLEQEQPR